MVQISFKDYKVVWESLLPFGFIKSNNVYSYTTEIVEGQFQMTVSILPDEKLETKVIDQSTETEYVLHLDPSATGKFVTQVATEYDQVLKNIQDKCYRSDIFKEEQAKRIIQLIDDTYQDQLEFLWKKFPKNAIWRRKDTHKWYGLFSVIPKSKLNLDSNDLVTAMDLRAETTDIEELVDNQTYFPGYHMSKKNWYTIILNDSVSDSEITKRIQKSYQLAR